MTVFLTSSSSSYLPFLFVFESRLTPIYKNTAPTVKCPFCATVYTAEFSGELCDVCAISQIGADAVGLQLRAGN